MRSTSTTLAVRPKSGNLERNLRFEYRVWGEHRKARKLLRKLAESEVRETVEDCYLLLDDPAVNAKIRDTKVKVKHLVSEKKGFEQWTSAKHCSIAEMPAADDRKGLKKVLKSLGLDDDVRPLFVTKRRRRYQVGDLQTEVTDMEIHETGEIVRTLSIQGDDLRELVKLRKKLGLKGEPNTSVHRFLDEEIDVRS